MQGLLVQVNSLDDRQGMPELESEHEPIFEGGSQLSGAFLKRAPKGNHTLAHRNMSGEGPVLQLVEFSLCDGFFQILGENVPD